MSRERVRSLILAASLGACALTSSGAAVLAGENGRSGAVEASSAPRPIQQPLPKSVDSMGFHWIDGVIVAVYVAGVLGLGWYYSRRQDSTDEYFVGNRAMNSILVGVSLFATLLSTITYLSAPGEMIKHGPVILISIVAIPFAYLLVGYWLVPVYMRHRVTSAYELLEMKLGVGVRMTGAVTFIMLRLVWMSLLIFMASKAMTTILDLGATVNVLGLDVGSVQFISVVAGAVAIVYSSLGGLRAVVITDLLQTLLLFGGAILVIATVTIRLGGFEWVPTSWDESWDTQPLFSIDPRVRVTAFGTVLATTLWWVCTAGGDQTVVQRFMATRDAKAARRSFLTNSLAGALVIVILSLVGFALLEYFKVYRGRLPAGHDLNTGADLLFPHYIAHHLPVGLSGLVVAGMFAAAMSSLDSGVNSISAVVMTDFVKRFKSRPMTQKEQVRFAQVLALSIGLIVIYASSLMEHVPGNFLEMAKRTNELFVGPLFLLFFMALFVPFATGTGTICGALVGLATAVLVGYSNPLLGIPEISFQWILSTSLTTGLSAGCLVSWLGRRLS